MISLSQRRPAVRRHLGQLSPFIAPGEAVVPTTAPSPTTPSMAKPIAVVAGLGLTALSAASAYVGINYGMDKKNTGLQRALGWTVGVIGVMSGIARLFGTALIAFTPTDDIA